MQYILKHKIIFLKLCLLSETIRVLGLTAKNLKTFMTTFRRSGTFL